MTILYVDDDSDDREIMGAALQEIDPGFTYIQFSSGDDIIEFLSDRNIKPDYVFIDINMPRMNGYECVRTIRSRYGIEFSRIVMYSTTFNSKDIEKFKSIHVSTLQKTPTFAELIQNLQAMFVHDGYVIPVAGNKMSSGI